MLSKASRNLLVQSVLSTVASYAMNTAMIPSSVVDHLEKLNRCFFWGENENERKLHTIAWEIICQPKDMGGTGIRRLREMNYAMLAKLIWRMIQDEDVLWVKVLKAKYGSLLHHRRPVPPCTHTWRSMIAALPVVIEGLQEETNSPDIEGSNHSKYLWRGSTNGRFSTRSAYLLQFKANEHSEKENWNKLWSIKGPHRGNLLLWQARHDKLPTGQLLFRRKLREHPICAICDDGEDSGLHVLRDCWYTRRLWQRLVPRKYWLAFFRSRTVKEWVDYNLHVKMEDEAMTEEWAYVFRESVQTIWYWRNKLLHNPQMEKPPLTVLMDRIIAQVRELRIAWNSKRQDVDLANNVYE